MIQKHTHHSHIRQLIERNPEKAKERVGKELDVISIRTLKGLFFSIEMYINTFKVKIFFSPLLNFCIFTSNYSWTLKNLTGKQEMEELETRNFAFKK